MKLLKIVLSTAFATVLLVPTFGSFAQAQEDDQDSVMYSAELMARTSCRARAIDRYYCPAFGGSQWMGPYWDNGCSVKCSTGERAVCHEATCEDGQTGRPVPSSCTCQ